MERVQVFDTTLRDGEQAAGTRLGAREKLEVARQLQKLGVDVIEAGYPLSSPEDFAAVRLVAEEDAWVLEVDATGDVAMERLAVQVRSDLLTEVFGHKLSLREAPPKL